MTRKQITEIVNAVGKNFRTFGGGQAGNQSSSLPVSGSSSKPRTGRTFGAGDISARSVFVSFAFIMHSLYAKPAGLLAGPTSGYDALATC